LIFFFVPSWQKIKSAQSAKPVVNESLFLRDLCDISIPADSYIDWRDLKVLTDNWLAAK